MRLAWVFYALLLAGLAGPAVGHAAEADCTAQTAVPVAIETIQKSYPRWAGRCVRVRGIVFQRRLYADRRAFLERPPSYDGKALHAIVLNPVGAPATRRPVLVEVVGRVRSCASDNDAVGTLQAQHPDQVIMTSGYCHTSLENYLRPVSRTVLDNRPIPRLTEAELAPGERPLVEAPANLPGRAGKLAAARATAAAITARDEAAFERLTDPDLQADLARLNGAPPPEGLRDRLAEIHNTFARLTARPSPFARVSLPDGRQERTLMWREDKSDATGDPSLIVCWCKGPDCTGRWPVTRLDADNLPDRPYLCVGAGDFTLGLEGRRTVQIRVPLETEGFAEPGRW